MTAVLLKTKLRVPPTRPEQVRRTRLFERLDAGLSRKLTLIAAPAGFGKTTLVSAWVKERGITTAWLSLDKDDNDPGRYWSYFITALQTVEAGIGEDGLALLRSMPSPSFESILHRLLNEIGNIQTRFVLVQDDFHVIENQQIQEGIQFLVNHLPSSMNLILSTRANPPWPIARLRGRGEITELRVEDLRFSIEETTEFLNSIMGLALAPEDVIALDERTEGWVVGLQMSALSMQGRRDKSEFISAFAGSHRFILDYLVEEVLNRQPIELQEFLLKTSILDRMTGSLCDVVTNRNDGQSILKQLDEANLFLLSLDDERRWYRYHHLFADILREALPQKFPNQVSELYHRASQWYAKYGMLPEATNYALMSGDIDYLAQLIEENAIPIITVFSEHLPVLAGWLNVLPGEILHSRPWLAVARAWVLAYSGDLDSAEAVILETEKAISGKPANTSDGGLQREHLAGYLAAIRGYWYCMKGNIDCGAEWMEKALLNLPQTDEPTRVFSAIVLGAAIGMKGDLEGGIQVLSEAASTHLDAIYPLLSILILGELAGLQILTGRIRQVIATCEKALHLAYGYYRSMGVQPPNTGFVYARLGFVLREQNKLEAAIYYAQEAVRISKNWGQKDSLCLSYTYLALALQSHGEAVEAVQTMKKARQVSRDLSSSVDVLTAAYEAKLHGGSGDTAFLARWCDERGLSSDDEVSFFNVREYIVYARYLLIQDKTEECLALIARLLPIVENAGAMIYEIELLELEAMALHSQGKLEQAVAPLVRALHLAEPEGYERIFVDEGVRIRELLRQAVQSDLTIHNTSRLLAILEAGLQPEGEKVSATSTWRSKAANKTLTRREIEILKMLITPQPVDEIAVELCISTSTLRTHLRNIYDKLGVHSRMEAVIIAREIKLQ
jgi:ATP/maltotriose-dependent transcriptional regulator MalT